MTTKVKTTKTKKAKKQRLYTMGDLHMKYGNSCCWAKCLRLKYLRHVVVGDTTMIPENDWKSFLKLFKEFGANGKDWKDLKQHFKKHPVKNIGTRYSWKRAAEHFIVQVPQCIRSKW